MQTAVFGELFSGVTGFPLQTQRRKAFICALKHLLI